MTAWLARGALAQGGPLDAPRLDPLPEAPAWQSLLFEKPLPLVVACVGLGLVVAWAFRRTHPRRAMLAAGTGVILGAAFTALAASVHTEREHLASATLRLVDAVVEPDAQKLRPMFALDVQAEGPGFMLRGRDELADWLDTQMRGDFRVTEWKVLELRSGVDSPQVARTQARVRVQPERSRSPVIVWMHMDWYRPRAGEAWQLRGVRPVWVSGYGNIDRR